MLGFTLHLVLVTLYHGLQLVLSKTIRIGDTKGRFTPWPKVERPSIYTNQIARNQEFGLLTLHTKTKLVQRLLQFKMLTF
jgi:hypothetical protein